MKKLTRFKALIEAKSKVPTLDCEVTAFRAHLGFSPDTMRRDGFDPSTIELHEQFFNRLESYAEQPLIGEYLTTLTPTDSYEASGVWVCTLKQIKNAAFGGGSPDEDLFPHGYVPIAGDGCGNSISFHFPSGLVVFAHHERVQEAIAGDHCILADDIASFLDGFLNDRFAARLEELG